MKGVDRADQYLSYYSIFRKTKKWTKRVVMFLSNCALFNSFKTYATLNGRKMTYKKFLHKAALSWISDVSSTDSQSDETDSNNNLNTSEPIRRAPKSDHPERLSCIKKHELIRIVTSGKSKKPQKQCRVCASKKIRSRTCFVCKFCNIPLHKGDCYERYHTLNKY